MQHQSENIQRVPVRGTCAQQLMNTFFLQLQRAIWLFTKRGERSGGGEGGDNFIPRLRLIQLPLGNHNSRGERSSSCNGLLFYSSNSQLASCNSLCSHLERNTWRLLQKEGHESQHMWNMHEMGAIRHAFVRSSSPPTARSGMKASIICGGGGARTREWLRSFESNRCSFRRGEWKATGSNLWSLRRSDLSHFRARGRTRRLFSRKFHRWDARAEWEVEFHLSASAARFASFPVSSLSSSLASDKRVAMLPPAE